MKAQVYRNLDRPFTLFGIRGRYIVIAGVTLLGVLVISLIVGSACDAFVGLATAMILTAAAYLTLLEVQQRFPEKALGRRLAAMNLPKFILIRSKVWKR